MLPFYPKYGLGHPRKYVILYKNKKYIGSKYPQKNQFNFENSFIDCQVMLRDSEDRLVFENLEVIWYSVGRAQSLRIRNVL